MENAIEVEAREEARRLARREERGRRAQALLVAGFSLALHVALATSLGRGQARSSKVTREPTRIDIQVRRPPPPPEPPAQETATPPPPRAEAPRSTRPRPAPTPEPAQPAPPPVAAEGTIAPVETPLARAPDPVISAPAQAPAPAPAPAAPVRVEAREGANYRHNPRPAYPRVAQREGWEGTVTLRVNVLPNGRPGAIRVQRSSGRDVLDDAASEAVSGWSFTPALLDGAPTSGWVTVPIVFRLGR